MNPPDAPSPSQRNAGKRLLHGVGAIAALAITALFVWYVARSLRGHDLAVYADPRAFIAIGVATLIYCCNVPINALAWRTTLRGVGTDRSWRELTAILGFTQIAKYIPGNVGQYVGRGGLSLKRGIAIRPFTVTVLLEIVLTIAAALCVGLCAGVLSDVGSAVLRAKQFQLLIVGVLLLSAIIGAFVFRRFAPDVLRRLAPQYAHILEGKLLPPTGTVVRAFGLYAFTCLGVGVALIVLARIFFTTAPHDYWLLLASFSLAWVIGFVTPGAPAGLGVREGLLLLMLTPVYGTSLAGVLIVALRIVTTLGDLICCIGGLILLPGLRRTALTNGQSTG